MITILTAFIVLFDRFRGNFFSQLSIGAFITFIGTSRSADAVSTRPRPYILKKIGETIAIVWFRWTGGVTTEKMYNKERIFKWYSIDTAST